MTRETLSASGLCAIVSQDCDLARGLNAEPYVMIAPLSELSGTDWEAASGRRSTRYFAYPGVPGHQGRQLALDLRVVQSIEKAALLSPHVRRTPCPLTEPRRGELRTWLGARFGRFAFPNEVVRQVLDPIDTALARLGANPQCARALPTIVYYGLRWVPGQRSCSLLLVTDPALRERQKVHDADLAPFHKALQKAVNHAARNGDHTIACHVHDAETVSARDLLEHAQVLPDVPDLAELGT
jgi:hypothetical protein